MVLGGNYALNSVLGVGVVFSLLCIADSIETLKSNYLRKELCFLLGRVLRRDSDGSFKTFWCGISVANPWTSRWPCSTWCHVVSTSWLDLNCYPWCWRIYANQPQPSPSFLSHPFSPRIGLFRPTPSLIAGLGQPFHFLTFLLLHFHACRWIPLTCRMSERNHLFWKNFSEPGNTALSVFPKCSLCQFFNGSLWIDHLLVFLPVK